MLYSAGTSLRRVRSPEAPKTTTVVVLSLPSTALNLPLEFVAAELVAQSVQQLVAEVLGLAGGEPLLQGRGDHRGRDTQLYGLCHRPPALARILNVGSDAV